MRSDIPKVLEPVGIGLATSKHPLSTHSYTVVLIFLWCLPHITSCKFPSDRPLIEGGKLFFRNAISVTLRSFGQLLQEHCADTTRVGKCNYRQEPSSCRTKATITCLGRRIFCTNKVKYPSLFDAQDINQGSCDLLWLWVPTCYLLAPSLVLRWKKDLH